jgi:hypothetical protein
MNKLSMDLGESRFAGVGMVVKPTQRDTRVIFENCYKDFDFQDKNNPSMISAGIRERYASLPAAKRIIRLLGEEAIPFLISVIDKQNDYRLNGIVMEIKNTHISDLKNEKLEVLDEGEVGRRLVQRFLIQRDSDHTLPLTPPDSDSSRSNSKEDL